MFLVSPFLYLTRIGARAPLKKEDVLLAKWDVALHDRIYKIKPQYKATVLEWAKKEDLTL